jgi:hypothetical protein
MVTRLAVRADRAFDGDRQLPRGALVLVDGDRITAVSRRRCRFHRTGV